ncbi:S-methyl thiohydantoin desulfurase domain-containing protein [Spongiactinospora gelatinilytica]|nr:DUF917 family protein [Spongiactinospora gelatinilytica]
MARGAAVLGGGGAGDPFIAEVMLGEVLRDKGPIDVIGPDELDDDADVAPLALMGSPHALSEKLLGTAELPILFSGNALRSRPPAAVMPYEMAGMNALYPLAAAALLEVPCVDGDFAGRGVPSLDLVTLELDDGQPDAYILCDPNRRTVTIQKIDVGGTNTDAVVLDGSRVVAATKAPTSEDVTSGILTALGEVRKAVAVDDIASVFIGTTALHQRDRTGS